MPPIASTHLLAQSFKTAFKLSSPATSVLGTAARTRLFSTSFSRKDETTSALTEHKTDSDSTTAAAAEEEEDPTSSASSSSSGVGGRGYRAWLHGDGAQYRRGIKGATNWIGETPFPLNPTFKPLPPVSETIKTKVFHAYLGNIQTPSSTSSIPTSPTDSVVIRAISAKFGLSMPRVRAIIRLKELEQAWKAAGLPLQQNLRVGMESFLGVKNPSEQGGGANWRGKEAAYEGERVDQVRAKGKAAFEMIDVESGERSVFLPLLQHLPTSTSNEGNVEPTAPPRAKEPSSRVRIVQATRPGRPRFSFENVAGTEKGAQLARTYDPKKTKRGNRKRVV